MKTSGPLALIAAAGLLGGSACSERNLAPLEGPIRFAIGESYPTSPSPPSIFLSLETEKVYGCCNYALVAQIHQVGNAVVADIRGVEEPAVCLTALGPAASGKFLDLEDGDYALEFQNGIWRSVFELSINEESITVRRGTGSGSVLAYPKYSVFWRYPRNSFAVLCGTMVETSWIYEDFLSRLRGAVDLREIEFPADGELGYPRAPQGYWVNHPGRYFVYEDPQDFEAAGDVLEAYVRDVIGQLPGVGIKLLNWQNEAFRSWLMD